MLNRKTASQLLGTPPNASTEDIEHAFRRKLAEHEGDAGSDPWEFDQVREAYRLLTTKPHESPPQQNTTPSHASVNRRVAAPQPAAHHSIDTPIAKEPHVVWKMFFKQLPLQNETSVFILVNMLDFFMTYLVINVGAFESNPIANFFLRRWGFDGLIAFKLGIVAFVALLSQVIARRDLTRAKQLLWVGSIIVGAVVIYTVMLYVRRLS